MPPKTTRRHRQGAESRQRILEAALEIAAVRGYDGTTVSLVTERASLPPSSVYWHFRNKDDLMAAALEHSYAQWRAQRPVIPASDEPADQQIRDRIGRMTQTATSQPEFLRLGLMLVLMRSPDPIAARDRYLAVRQDTRTAYLAWWQRLLADSPTCAAAAQRLTILQLSASDGLFLASAAEPTWDIPGMVEELAEAFVLLAHEWGIRAPESATDPLPEAPDLPTPAEPDSRLRLIAAAAEVVAERGYVGTTISRVVARSGVPVSSLYYFFKDKDDLLAAVVDHSFAEWNARQPPFTPSGPVERAATLRHVLRSSTRSLAGAPDFLRIGHLASLELREVDTAARRGFIDTRDRVLAGLTAWFTDALAGTSADQDPGLPQLLARILMAMTDGLFIAEQVDEWEWDFDDVVAGLVALLETVIRRHS